MTLEVLWFVVVAFFWTGFFVLEGFDFGVGALHLFVGRSDVERRVAINAIGPVWDGNEVWLIVAGASVFAAFPAWYATWFSAGYLALFLVIVALILRGVSFEWRGKFAADRWRGTWSTTLTIGSVLTPLLLGVALGDLLAGLPIDSEENYTGTFWNLLTPYGLLTGATVLVLCLLHGATFLTLRTGEPVRGRAARLGRVLVWPSVALALIYAGWTYSLGGKGVWRLLAVALPVAALLAAVLLISRHRERQAFAATAIGIGGVILALFANLYPYVMVSTTAPANSLTVSDAASASYALTVMTWVAVVLVPVILLYQGWSYHVFRSRVMVPTEADGVRAGQV